MIYKNYNQKYCAISSLLKLVMNQLNNKSVNVEERLITFESLRKYLGHVPGFTRSASGRFSSYGVQMDVLVSRPTT